MSNQTEVEEKVVKLNYHLSCKFKAAQDLAEIINDKVPPEKKIGIPGIDTQSSIKENASVLVDFIERIKDIVEEIDESLEKVLSPESYAKVASVTASTDQVLDIIQTVTVGLVSIVGPLVSTIARTLKSSNMLQSLAEKLGIVQNSTVVVALHDAHISNCTVEVPAQDMHELDDAIEILKPDDTNTALDFVSTVNQMIMLAKWKDKH